MATNPSKSGGSGGRDKAGRFLAGNCANPKGRPRAFDIRKAAEQHAAKVGMDLQAALGEIIEALIIQAKAGDVAAAKLVMDRLCGALEKTDVQVNVQNNIDGPPMPPSGRLLDDIDRLRVIVADRIKTNGNGSG